MGIQSQGDMRDQSEGGGQTMISQFVYLGQHICLLLLTLGSLILLLNSIQLMYEGSPCFMDLCCLTTFIPSQTCQIFYCANKYVYLNCFLYP